MIGALTTIITKSIASLSPSYKGFLTPIGETVMKGISNLSFPGKTEVPSWWRNKKRNYNKTKNSKDSSDDI